MRLDKIAGLLELVDNADLKSAGGKPYGFESRTPHQTRMEIEKLAKQTAKTVEKLPASESGHGVLCRTKDSGEYVISYCPEKSRFTLWRKNDNKFEQKQTAKSPLELYAGIPW